MDSTSPLSRRRPSVSPRLAVSVVREAGLVVSRTYTFAGDIIRIGSAEGNDVTLHDDAVSKFHSRITRTRTCWEISDSGSLNGTQLSGVRARIAELPHDIEVTLELGRSAIRLREVEGDDGAALLDQANFGSLFGTSEPMRRLFAMLERVASSDSSVLLEGESGTGKELAAMEIVRRSGRAHEPLIVVDCSSLAGSLIESELFGHVRGAFTGAVRDRVGAFEAADGGTLFLDEIGELPLELQPKLLRALEQREVRRIGAVAGRRVDVRVIAATNRELEREVNHGRFREDLFFRLSVVAIRMPALRERLDDLEILVRSMLDSLDASEQSHLFTPDVLRRMAHHDWPGNVRELRNFVERALVMHHVPTEDAPGVDEATLPAIDIERSFRDAKGELVRHFERRYVAKVLEWAGGNMSRAARKARMDRMHLHRLAQLHGLKITTKP